MNDWYTTDDQNGRGNTKLVYYGSIELVSVLGEGAHSTVYLGRDAKSGKESAVKVPKTPGVDETKLKREYDILKDLHTKSAHYPYCVLGQRDSSNFNMIYLVMQKVGSNLKDLMQATSHAFTIAEGVKIMIGGIQRIWELQKSGYVHRDVKPENMCIGEGDNNSVYLIDMGVSSEYLDEEDDHVACYTNLGFIGTSKFAPFSSHYGISNLIKAAQRVVSLI